jgi:ketosteroid isomerase-like protein
MHSDRHETLGRVLNDWDAAMITNAADAIGTFMDDDWVIVGPDGSVTDKDSFLEAVRSGILTHDVMITETPLMRMHGDCATVIAWGVSGGTYAGAPFRHRERSSSVFVWASGRWRCVLTHLSQYTDVLTQA